MSTNNTNKVAIITGAYSGLGASLSKLLLKEGYNLVLSGKDKIKLDAFLKELKKNTKPKQKFVAIKTDVRKSKDCERLIERAVKKFGKIDLLINNAGVWKKTAIEEALDEDIKEMYEVNTFGPMYCSRAAVKVMKAQGYGHILNIGSTAAIDYKSSHIAYGSSKSALIGFTGSLKTELDGTGIRVSAFSPGGMKTNLFRLMPERMRNDFMEPDFVAQKILEHINNPNSDWHTILRRS